MMLSSWTKVTLWCNVRMLDWPTALGKLLTQQIMMFVHVGIAERATTDIEKPACNDRAK